ncbi:MAG: hypothetical protein ABIR17_04280 [Pseudolysinimonas sp.]|uniref:hypothetical protein n=1 Tax=Pseudolysinimonas sp. TaxID=2680009 RepID=UPI0032667373
MTVAYPTTDIQAPHLDAVVTIACFSCGTRTQSREPFCAHCGSRVTVPVKAGTASLAATRSLQFATLGVLANILLGGSALGVLYLLSDASHLTQAALILEVVRFVVVVTLFVVSVRFGIRGIAQTQVGGLRRRSWAILGIVVSGLWTLLVTASLAATTILFFVL